MNKGIKQSQLAFIIILIMGGNKMITLPALISKDVGIDSYLIFIILLAIDLFCLFLLLWAFNLNNNKQPLEEILSKSIGTVPSKAVYALLAVYFLIRTLNIMIDTLGLFSSLLLNTNWVAFAIPVLLVTTFVIYKGFFCVSRVIEIILAPVLISFALIMGLSLNMADFTNLLPFALSGTKTLFQTALNYSFYFADFLFIIFFFGKINRSKYLKTSILSAFAIGAVCVIILNVLFVGLFSNTGWLHSIALSKISQFNVDGSVMGRLDWINIIIWSVSLIIKAIIFIFCINVSLNVLIGHKKTTPNWWALGTVYIIILVLPLVTSVQSFVSEFIIYGWGKYIFSTLQYALPISLPLLVYISNKKFKLDLVKIKNNDSVS